MNGKYCGQCKHHFQGRSWDSLTNMGGQVVTVKMREFGGTVTEPNGRCQNPESEANGVVTGWYGDLRPSRAAREREGGIMPCREQHMREEPDGTGTRDAGGVE